MAAPDVDPDEAWQSVLAVGAELGETESGLRDRFAEHFGLSPDEASAGELLLFRARLQDPAGTDPDAHRYTVGTHLGEDWVRVEGGGLPQPIQIRIAVVGDRPRIVGLHLDEGREVSADVLRSLRLGQVLSGFLSGYTMSGPNVRGLPHSDQHAVLNDVDAWIEWGLMHDFLNERVAREAAAPIVAKRGSAPSETALRNFAHVYGKHFKRQQHGALAAAAREIPVARSTAYRWLELCRARCYLSTEEAS